MSAFHMSALFSPHLRITLQGGAWTGKRAAHEGHWVDLEIMPNLLYLVMADSFTLDTHTHTLSLSDLALAMKILCTMSPSLNILSLAIVLAPIISVLASNDCAPSTWSKAGLKIRQVETSITSRSLLSSSASLTLSITLS